MNMVVKFLETRLNTLFIEYKLLSSTNKLYWIVEKSLKIVIIGTFSVIRSAQLQMGLEQDLSFLYHRLKDYF